MKKENSDKFRELISLVLCVIVLLLIANYAGFLKVINFDSIFTSFGKFTSTLSSTDIEKGKINPGNQKTRSEYNGIKVRYIPANVLSAVDNSYQWNVLFKSDKKVIFFVYSTSDSKYADSDFYNKISGILSENNNSYYYNLVAFDTKRYEYMRTGGDIGPSKICNSLEECRNQAVRANNYSAASAFVERCARTMCIINPKREEFVAIKARDSKIATDYIEKLKGW